MSLKSFLMRIGLFFSKLVRDADNAIKRLTPQVRRAFEIGSNVIAFINANLDADSSKLKEIIKSALNITDEQLADALKKALDFVNIGDDLDGVDSLDELLTVAQAYLGRLKDTNGSRWAKTSIGWAQEIAQAFAPEGTKTKIFTLLMEVFYQVYVKPKH